MNIKFLWIGKSKHKAYNKILDDYENRLRHYTKLSVICLKDVKVKSKNSTEQTKIEAELIISKLKDSDYIVLLDEGGKHLSSIKLSEWIEHKLNISIAQVVFIIAGPYGAHQQLKDRADFILSLSELTLTHDMVRIFIMEQVYRAFTIIRGEKYHNE